MNGAKVKPSSKDKKSLNLRNSMIILVFRWFTAASFFVCFFTRPRLQANHLTDYVTLAIPVVYCILITIHVSNYKENNGLNSMKLAYFDIILLSVISIQIPEIFREFYILYFFILAFYGFYSSVKHTVKLGLLVNLFYTLTFIFLQKGSWTTAGVLELIMKNTFLLLASYGVCTLSREMKKYGDLHKKEFKLARTDKLTGLANRHYFDQKLIDEATYSDMNGTPLNILIFDLDNFKKFNDTYGHVWGDKLLMLFSDIIKQNIRKTDIPVRYGGEEFLILVRDLDVQLARAVGERIRKQLERQKIFIGNDDGRRKMTVSCGVAQYPKDSGNIREAVELADKALYAAKGSGKNMVFCYDELDQNQLQKSVSLNGQ